MGIKKFETRNYLGEKLGRRGLVFDEKDMKKALIEHNSMSRRGMKTSN